MISIGMVPTEDGGVRVVPEDRIQLLEPVALARRGGREIAVERQPAGPRGVLALQVRVEEHHEVPALDVPLPFLAGLDTSWAAPDVFDASGGERHGAQAPVNGGRLAPDQHGGERPRAHETEEAGCQRRTVPQRDAREDSRARDIREPDGREGAPSQIEDEKPARGRAPERGHRQPQDQSCQPDQRERSREHDAEEADDAEDRNRLEDEAPVLYPPRPCRTLRTATPIDQEVIAETLLSLQLRPLVVALRELREVLLALVARVAGIVGPERFLEASFGNGHRQGDEDGRYDDRELDGPAIPRARLPRHRPDRDERQRDRDPRGLVVVQRGVAHDAGEGRQDVALPARGERGERDREEHGGNGRHGAVAEPRPDHLKGRHGDEARQQQAEAPPV